LSALGRHGQTVFWGRSGGRALGKNTAHDVTPRRRPPRDGQVVVVSGRSMARCVDDESGLSEPKIVGGVPARGTGTGFPGPVFLLFFHLNPDGSGVALKRSPVLDGCGYSPEVFFRQMSILPASFAWAYVLGLSPCHQHDQKKPVLPRRRFAVSEAPCSDQATLRWRSRRMPTGFAPTGAYARTVVPFETEPFGHGRPARECPKRTGSSARCPARDTKTWRRFRSSMPKRAGFRVAEQSGRSTCPSRLPRRRISSDWRAPERTEASVGWLALPGHGFVRFTHAASDPRSRVALVDRRAP